jgi:hypothetical protein
VTERTAELRIVEDLWRQLSAVDPALYRRANRSIRRRRTMRTLALALLALLGLAGAALAAKTLLFGKSVSPPYRLTTFARPAFPGSAKLLPLRVSDPQGGPPWAVRTFVPPQARGTQQMCVQIGRVVSDQLVALGIDGAFDDDKLAHPLPVEAAGCAGIDAHGNGTGTLAPEIRDASGVIFQRHCLDPQTRSENESIALGAQLVLARVRRTGPRSKLEQAVREYRRARNLVAHPPPPCDPAALRTVVTGFVGPAGGTVTLVEPGGKRHVAIADRRNDDAYLFVLDGQVLDSTMTLSVQYPNGAICPLPAPWADRAELRKHPQSARSLRACLRASGYVPRRSKLR